MYYITAFKPFMGRAQNGSETLVCALSQHPELTHINFKTLDVAWSAFDQFFQEVQRGKVSGVIGFGEGKGSGIVIERVGKNIATGTDEFGVTKTNVLIDEGRESTNASRIDIPTGKKVKITDSSNAGDFLCNYELFHINTLDTPISAFIHLPPQLDMPDDDYIKLFKPDVLEIICYNFMQDKV